MDGKTSAYLEQALDDYMMRKLRAAMVRDGIGGTLEGKFRQCVLSVIREVLYDCLSTEELQELHDLAAQCHT